MSLRRPRILAGSACAVLSTVAASLILVSGGSSSEARASGIVDTVVTCNGLQIPIVGGIDLGGIISGLSLVDSAKLCNSAAPGEPATIPFTSAIFGDCNATSEEGCGPPLEVQTWPECDRNLALYTVTDADGNQQPYPHTMSALPQAPQVPVATFDDGTRSEIYTGSATIVIFAEDSTVMNQALDTIGSLVAPTALQDASQLLSAAQGSASC